MLLSTGDDLAALDGGVTPLPLASAQLMLHDKDTPMRFDVSYLLKRTILCSEVVLRTFNEFASPCTPKNTEKVLRQQQDGNQTHGLLDSFTHSCTVVDEPHSTSTSLDNFCLS